MNSIHLLGIRVDDVTYDEAVAIVSDLLIEGGCHQVVTPNAEIVMGARDDPELRQIMNTSALSIPDGAGLLLAARLAGRQFREQVTGTDLAVRLADLAASAGYRTFLLGAANGVAAAAARQLRSRFPDLQIAGTYSGSSQPEHDAVTLQVIREAAPVNILLVAYGAPYQEKWIARNLSALRSIAMSTLVRHSTIADAPYTATGTAERQTTGVDGSGVLSNGTDALSDHGIVAMGVGGAFDFLAGRVPRAPSLMRRAGLDWLFRLICQPWRWRRQLALPRFVAAALAEAASQRWAHDR